MSTATVNLSAEQSAAVEQAGAFIQRSLLSSRRLSATPAIFRIAGYAGTGKTTILRTLVETFPGMIAPCAYTGKAASVLRAKGIPTAQTIHGTIYRLVGALDPDSDDDFDGDEDSLLSPSDPRVEMRFVRRSSVEMGETACFVIDEASMVGRDIFHDLQTYGLPIVAVGDPGQLPPVSPGDINLMDAADVTLQQVHRQGEGSAILELARQIRLGEDWSRTRKPEAVVVRGQDRRIAWDSIDIVLCGFNKTRQRLNLEARSHYRRSGLVVDGERIVCLKNDQTLGVFNGLCGIVESVRRTQENVADLVVAWDGAKESRRMRVAFDQGDGRARERRGCRALVDYAYALTVHKAQGSEWPRVAVIDEQWPDKWDAKRWRYTAVTRASQGVVLVLP